MSETVTAAIAAYKAAIDALDTAVGKAARTRKLAFELESHADTLRSEAEDAKLKMLKAIEADDKEIAQ